MKVVKPQRVGVLTRVIEHGRRCHFVVGAVGYFPLGNPVPLTEVDLWKFLPKALAEGAIFDAAMPKSRGEVIVTGSCFAPEERTRQCAVRVTLGAVDKRLLVFGERQWRDGEITEPEVFREIPIDWSRAFGGEGFAQNPLGRGMKTVDGARWLPNVEAPSQRVIHPGDRPAPAGFGAVDFTWPQRAVKRGTYDTAWLERDYPGLAADIDWTVFNDAPPDQWIDGYWRGDERFSLTNLHPTRSVFEGFLPAMRARAFVTLQPENETIEPGPDALTEVALRLDTVHLFPGEERVALIWRGTVEVREDDGADVRHLLLALEDLDAPREVDHYRAVFTRRIDKKSGALEALRDRDLMPPPRGDAVPVAASTDAFTEALAHEGHAAKNAARRAQREHEEMRQGLREKGLDPDVYGPPPPEPPEPQGAGEDLAAYVERMDAAAENARASVAERDQHARENLEAVCKRHGLDFAAMTSGGQRPSFSADEELAKLRSHVARGRAAGQPLTELEAMCDDPAFVERMRAAERAVKESRLKYGHLLEPGPKKSRAEALRLRAWVEARLRSGEGVTGADLSGADLSSMDLSGANLARCQLDGATLTQTILSFATLTEAVLSRADLTGAVLSRAVLTGANLGRAVLTRAVCDHAVLSGAVLAEAVCDHAVFTKALVEGCDFHKASFIGADLAGVDLDGALLFEVKLDGAKLDGAKLNKSILLECSIARGSFVGAELVAAVLYAVKGDGAVFREARADKIRAVMGSSLEDCVFLAASLRGANLRETKLDRADLRRAVLDEADLSGASLREAKLHQASARASRWVRADLRGAGMIHIDLMDALLSKADLRGADLQGASLYRADLFRSKGDRATNLADIHAVKARIDTRRDAPR